MGFTPGGAGRLLARAHVDAQAAHARHGRAGEQDGTHCLGDEGARRELSRSRRRHLSAVAAGMPGDVSWSRKGKGRQSSRRDRGNLENPQHLQSAL